MTNTTEKVTVRMTVEIAVSVAVWAETYGMDNEDVRGDAEEYFERNVPGALLFGLPSLHEVDGTITVKVI